MDNVMMTFYKSALLGVASNKPLCDEYKSEWRACGEDKKKLLTFSLRQQCIPFVMLYSYEGYGLSKEYLKKEYKNLINGLYTAKDADMVKGYTYTLCVDYNDVYEQNSDVASYMYCNNTFVVIKETKCPQLFVGCNSHLRLSLEGFNSIKVHLYDDSDVVIDDLDENSDVVVYKYSNNCCVAKGKYCFGKVKEFSKELRLQL